MDPEEQLEKLLEAFYDEEIDPKIAASKNILMLSMQMQNIEFLVQHGTLALATE